MLCKLFRDESIFMWMRGTSWEEPGDDDNDLLSGLVGVKVVTGLAASVQVKQC